MLFCTALIFIWTGFLLSISFFESWVKFRAQGVTLPAALSIGKLIFTILNRIEWTFALVVSLFWFTFIKEQRIFYLLLVIWSVLLLQTFWLLPALNRRVRKRIANEALAPSSLHFYFVGGEMLKLSCLLVLGIYLLNNI